MADQRTCKSCGNTFEGHYCNACGEKVICQKDRQLIHFVGELLNAMTFADSKLLRTLKTIFVKPGQYSANFVSGIRKPYMKPISIFFLANLVYFLVPMINTFNTSLHIQTHAFGNFHSNLARVWVNEAIEERGITYADYEADYNSKTTELSKLLLIVMVVLLALAFWPLHMGSKRHLLADHLTVALELMTFNVIFVLQITGSIVVGFALIGVRFLSVEPYISIMALLFLGYFIFKAEKHFYGFSMPRRLANTVLGIALFALTLICYRIMLFFVTFWIV